MATKELLEVRMRTRNSVSQAISPKSAKPKTTALPDDSSPEDFDKFKDYLAQENNELKADIKKLLEGQATMQSLISNLVKANSKKDIEIQKLSNRIDQLEQYTRRENIIISGLQTDHRSYASAATGAISSETHENAPNNEQQDLESQVIQFMDSVNIPISSSEISVCHTLKTKDKSKPPLIVMRFLSRKTKTRVMKAAALNRRALKHREVFVNEHLTAKNAQLAREARSLLRSHHIFGTWTKNCTVFVKYFDENHKPRVTTIHELSDLHQFKKDIQE